MKKEILLILTVMIMASLSHAAKIELAFHSGLGLKDFKSAAIGFTPAVCLLKNMYLEGDFFYYPHGWGDLESTWHSQEADGSYSWYYTSSKSSGLNVLLSLRYQFGKKNNKLLPFIIAGSGLVFEFSKGEERNPQHREGISEEFSETLPYLGLGAGFKYRLSKRVGLRFDARYFFYFLLDEPPDTEKFFRLSFGIYKEL